MGPVSISGPEARPIFSSPTMVRSSERCPQAEFTGALIVCRWWRGRMKERSGGPVRGRRAARVTGVGSKACTDTEREQQRRTTRMDKSLDYVIVGAGPAGLQTAYFLKKAGRSFVILERASEVGAFFRKFPRHRKMISIN